MPADPECCGGLNVTGRVVDEEGLLRRGPQALERDLEGVETWLRTADFARQQQLVNDIGELELGHPSSNLVSAMRIPRSPASAAPRS